MMNPTTMPSATTARGQAISRSASASSPATTGSTPRTHPAPGRRPGHVSATGDHLRLAHTPGIWCPHLPSASARGRSVIPSRCPRRASV
jgi:hypothetical protein